MVHLKNMLNGLIPKKFTMLSTNRIVYLIFGLACIYYASYLIEESDSFLESIASFIYKNSGNIIFAIFLYLLSHTFRALRLSILSPNPNFMFSSLLKEQYKANGVNLLLPFKLGEAYRLIYFKQFFGSYSNSFAVLISERMLDLFVIFLVLIITIHFFNFNFLMFQQIFQISIFLLLASIVIFYSFAGLLRAFSRLIILRDTTTRNVALLEIIFFLETSIRKLKLILKEKIIACLTLTFAIWALEIMVFFIFFDQVDQRVDVLILLAIAVSFSALLPNGPLGYGGLQIAFYYVGNALQIEGLLDLSLVYGLCIFGSGLVLSGLLFIFDFFAFNRRNDEK